MPAEEDIQPAVDRREPFQLAADTVEVVMDTVELEVDTVFVVGIVGHRNVDMVLALEQVKGLDTELALEHEQDTEFVLLQEWDTESVLIREWDTELMLEEHTQVER